MFIYILAVLILSFEPIGIHYFLFPDKGKDVVTIFLIWFQAFIVFGLLLTTKRRIINFVLFIFTLIVSVLIVWHRYYDTPMTLQVALSQLNEGLVFATKMNGRLFNVPLVVIWSFFFLQLFLLRYYRRPQKIALLRIMLGVPMIVFCLMTSLNYHNKSFYKYNFKSYCQMMGYAQAWWYEIWTVIDKERLVAKTIENSGAQYSSKIKGIPPREHIFIVQVESLDYAGFIGKFNNQEIMPFLHSLKEKSYFYHIFPRERTSSANSDFSVIASASNYDDFYTVFYYLLTPKTAAEIASLPRLLKKKGYVSRFYHGFMGSFYDREKYMADLGFDNVWFQENLPINKPEGYWGFEDSDVVDFILKKVNEKPHQKSLDFFITVSMHPPFIIASNSKKLITAPQNETEEYYNALHYTDNALRRLVTKSPENSLFIIYSDHHSEILNDTSTLLLIYDKQQTLSKNSSISFSEVPLIIRSVLN